MSNYIKVVENNRSTITAVIAVAQKRARVRTVSTDDVISLAKKAESILAEYGLPISERKGAIYEFVENDLPGAYKYRAASTHVCLIRKSTGWYIKSVTRRTIYPRGKTIRQMTITPYQREVLLVRHKKSFRVSYESDADRRERYCLAETKYLKKALEIQEVMMMTSHAESIGL